MELVSLYRNHNMQDLVGWICLFCINLVILLCVIQFFRDGPICFCLYNGDVKISGFPVFLTKKIQVLSRSKKPFSRLYCEQCLHQKADAKDVLKSMEYKTWKKLSQYNIKMLYILTFQVLSSFFAKFLVLSRFSDFLG